MEHTVRHTALGLGALALVTAIATPAAAQGNGPTVSVGGVGYVAYMYQFNNKPAGGPAPNAFDVTRSYVNVTANLGGGAGARITPDLYRDANGSLNIRIKYAYASFKPKGSPIGFRFGQTQAAWLDWEEGLWGFRMQGPMAVDRAGYLSSSEIGLALDGAWGGQAVNMQAGVYDGTGYHAGSGDGHKAVDARLSFRVLGTDDNGSRGGLRVTAYGLYAGPQHGGQRYRAIGMVSYKSKMVLLAAQGVLAADSTNSFTASDGTTTAATPLINHRVLSGYGTLNIPNSKAGLIARVDIVDPNTASASTNDQLTRIIGGLSYEIAPHLLGLVDVEDTSPQGGSSTATGFFHVQFSF
jgi:hypothetical protein